jgi:hypothetical protein
MHASPPSRYHGSGSPRAPNGYAWAERDALQLEADALAAAGDRDGAHAARREAEAMTRRLIPADLDLSWVQA